MVDVVQGTIIGEFEFASRKVPHSQGYKVMENEEKGSREKTSFKFAQNRIVFS